MQKYFLGQSSKMELICCAETLFRVILTHIHSILTTPFGQNHKFMCQCKMQSIWSQLHTDVCVPALHDAVCAQGPRSTPMLCAQGLSSTLLVCVCTVSQLWIHAQCVHRVPPPLWCSVCVQGPSSTLMLCAQGPSSLGPLLDSPRQAGKVSPAGSAMVE